MAAGGLGGNLDLLVFLHNRAQEETDPGSAHWSLQRHHPDGRRWLEVGRFGDREIARMALDAFVGAGHGDPDDFRVKKVTRRVT